MLCWKYVVRTAQYVKKGGTTRIMSARDYAADDVYKVAYNDYKQKWVLLHSTTQGIGGAGYQEVARADTKKEILKSGRTQAKNVGAVLEIEGMDGRLQETNRYN